MDPQLLVGLVTLTALELVLGIDNIIFIAILAGRLPATERARARSLGLGGALVTRILFLLSISWIMRLETPLFTLGGNAFSGRDLILIVGGLFLIGKATYEIHAKPRAARTTRAGRRAPPPSPASSRRSWSSTSSSRSTP